MRQERGIHLDLRELQMSAPSTVKEEDLLDFIRELDFEDILQYVQIPRHPFRPWGASRLPTDGMEAEPNEEGACRKEFESIFELLSGKGVRKILRLIVDDDDTCAHQDEVTEGLSKFEIEEFQWRKLDISSMVLRHGVPQVRTLHLLSSGNHSVLRDWSSTDGLNNHSLVRVGCLNTCLVCALASSIMSWLTHESVD
ncbi:hypothetical protein N658DRAFT_500886 [Parathielavia hyrcaniae]|uniref:Uncharacterized protein n=1 Tax=Parathielavia hyrcaniae TaxID=113614 RepID=A0AAN6PSR3_9PEZI|nr:hypothetical protein N658DRAFT_500886 [Parathielavia hyrcaniae]